MLMSLLWEFLFLSKLVAAVGMACLKLEKSTSLTLYNGAMSDQRWSNGEITEIRLQIWRPRFLVQILPTGNLTALLNFMLLTETYRDIKSRVAD